MEKIVIFGGSFDPIHNGHLRLARAASLMLNAEVVFVPAKGPRWKTTEATPEERVAMLQAALAEDGSPDFSMDLVEMKRSDPISYSVDTAEYFREKYPNRTLYWLIGGDEVNKFPSWKDPVRLSSLVQMVYIPRPDVPVDPSIVAQYHMIPLHYSGSGSVSSSGVRKLESLDIPTSVLTYIENHHLYFIKTLEEYLTGHREAHSLSVAHLAWAIAKKNMIINPDNAYIAGLLHDLGKHLSNEESDKIMQENYPQYLSYPSWCHHQFTGAYLAKKVFGIQDEAILDAISYHCTGKPHMPPLSKIVYSADKIDPSRGYDSTKMIAKCLANYYVGFLYVLKENRKFLKEQGELETTPLSEECFKLYLGEKKK
jgi:nicotinate-nucleotide adenylyltransferase